ncbi:MAG: ferrochelatase [Gammaproteobacteria bacterium]|nr:ferrochelatase [Gammaproteobacteria bacterium]
MTNKLAILVNLGTPESLETGAIRSWLREFLSDPRVVTLPRVLWLPILYLFVLTFRPGKVREKYAEIWREDSPLRLLTDSLADSVGNRLQAEGWTVRVAMTYGAPSLDDTLADATSFERTVVLPLYPQYSGSTTGAVYDRVGRILARTNVLPNLQLINAYYTEPGYARALADSLGDADPGAHTVFSFHGIPVAQGAKEPYEAQCRETASAVAAAAGLVEADWDIAFQSRFGPAPWLQPYTEDVLTALGKAGRPVRVICPGFAVECLETLEEIDMTYRATYLEAGGTRFTYVPALNDDAAHADLIATLVRNGGA